MAFQMNEEKDLKNSTSGMKQTDHQEEEEESQKQQQQIVEFFDAFEAFLEDC